MVLTEQQKKELVERLRLGREQKAAEKAAPKKEEKAAPKKAEKAAPKKAEPPAAPKPAPAQNPPVIPFEEELPPPIITDKPPKKEAQKKAPEPCLFEDVEDQCSSSPPTRKDKRLNKQKYMAIKFYEKPDERLYKRVMKSVQPDSSSDEEPPHEGLRILDYEKAKKTMITEAEKADIERRKMEAIVRLMG